MTVTDQTRTAVVGAAGTASIDLRPTNRQPWTVSQVGVQISFVSSATCRIVKNTRIITPVIFDTTTGAGVAAGEPPVRVLPGETLTVQFTGCTVGSVVEATFIYNDGT